VKTKEDVDLAVDKAVESGLINFGQKSWCIKRFKILSTISGIVFCGREYHFKRTNHYSKKEEQ
jgi:hypothetical protein